MTPMHQSMFLASHQTHTLLETQLIESLDTTSELPERFRLELLLPSLVSEEHLVLERQFAIVQQSTTLVLVLASRVSCMII